MEDPVQKIINEIRFNQEHAIERAIYEGLAQGCGVRVERGRFDVEKFSVKPDKNVPLGEIHEHTID